MAATAIPASDRLRRGEPPHYPFQPVRTRALADFEAAGSPPKLLAIVAPVGYGKTLLMTAIHQRFDAAGERCYWSTLDERDTQVEDVLLRLERQTARLSNPLHPTQALFRGDESVETRIESLLQTAREATAGFTAFIDNLHFCADPRLGLLLDRLLFETPASARFVLSSTAALPINLARAKLEGRVRQVGYSELSLDRDGLVELLGPGISAALGPDHLDLALQQTEGWPAAVRMMQIVMSNSAQPRDLLRQFSGSDEDLVALLNRQVLQGLDADRRDFLLTIAPLHSFDAALCEAMTGDAAAQAHLDWLVQHNVFMIPLDRSRSRFRLHGLFRQCLLGEARQNLSVEHRHAALVRAAQWCEQQAQWRDGIEYAIAANALEIASRILERSAQAFVPNRGDIPQYIAWARSLLDQGQTLGWEAEYWYIWALALNQRYDEGRHQLERLSRRIRRSRGSKQDASALQDIERRLDIIRMCIAVFTDELQDADERAAQWLATIHADDPFDITVARCIRSIYGSSAYRFVEARSAIQAAQASASQTQSEYARGWTVALIALPSILQGQYTQAYPSLLSALQTLPEHLGDNAGICGTLALLAASCAVEMGLDREAQRHLDQGLRTAHSHGFIDAVASGLDAALKLWSGAAEEAALLVRLQQIASHYPPRLAFLLGCHRIRRLLRLNRITEARAEADKLGLRADKADALPLAITDPRGRDVMLSTLIDLHISSDTGRAVSPLIAEQWQLAKSEGRVARQVDLILAQTLIEIADNRLPAAGRQLTRAISLATPRRIVRPFQDLAPSLLLLLEDTKPSAWNFASADERRFFADVCALVPMRDPGLQDRLITLNIDAQLREPLTPRQIELLRLLEAGLSNTQIADRIDRTLTTVKGHLQGIYAKLGVSNRSAALARARVLGLL